MGWWKRNPVHEAEAVCVRYNKYTKLETAVQNRQYRTDTVGYLIR